MSQEIAQSFLEKVLSDKAFVNEIGKASPDDALGMLRRKAGAMGLRFTEGDFASATRAFPNIDWLPAVARKCTEPTRGF